MGDRAAERHRRARAAVAISSFAGQRTQTACGQSAGPDVIVGDITGPAELRGRERRRRDRARHDLCNIGTQWANWVAARTSTPSIGAASTATSIVDGAGRFEQVGRAGSSTASSRSARACCCALHADRRRAPRRRLLGSRHGRANGSQGGLGPKLAGQRAHRRLPLPAREPARGSGSTARRFRWRAPISSRRARTGATRYFGEGQLRDPGRRRGGQPEQQRFLPRAHGRGRPERLRLRAVRHHRTRATGDPGVGTSGSRRAIRSTSRFPATALIVLGIAGDATSAAGSGTTSTRSTT